jgi:archaellum component FlaC
LSAFGDAFAALKNVLLMQERLDSMRSDIGRISGDLRTLTEKVGSINDRVIRIETMIEMTERQASRPRIE